MNAKSAIDPFTQEADTRAPLENELSRWKGTGPRAVTWCMSAPQTSNESSDPTEIEKNEIQQCPMFRCRYEGSSSLLLATFEGTKVTHISWIKYTFIYKINIQR